MAVTTYTQKYDSVSGVATFPTLQVHFDPNPVLSAVTVDPIISNITSTSATISWATSRPTSYGINFKNGVCPPAGCLISDGTLATIQSVQLVNLTPGTLYTFSVTVTTSGGLQTTSVTKTFTTATVAAPAPIIDTTLPEILNGGFSNVWDLNSDTILNSIFYVNKQTEYVKYYFPNQPGALSDGSIVVTPNSGQSITGIPGSKGAFISLQNPGALGNYTVAVIPGNSIVGDGVISYFNISVVQNYSYLQPDITYIDYPQTIVEADFKPLQYDFDIKLTSVNAETIEIYIGDIVPGQSPNLVVPATNPTTNLLLKAADLYAQSPTAFKPTTSGPLGAGSYFNITFSFIPFTNGIGGKIYGKTEVVTISVKRSEVLLTNEQIVDYIMTSFEGIVRTTANSYLLFDNDRYLKYHLKYQNSPFDSYVISNIGRDDVSYSLKVVSDGSQPRIPNSYGTTIIDSGREIVPTEYVVDPETGNTTRKYPAYPTLVVKLLEPLPGDIELNTPLWISKQLLPTIVEDIVITDEDVKVCTPLTPNFNADVLDQTGYQYFNDIVGTSATSTDVINRYISQSAFNLTDLAIDYTSGSNVTSSTFLKFDNFVNFSSAKTRIENFQYKLSSIEFWENKISSSLYVGSTPSANSFATLTSQSYLNTIWGIKNGFDGFERKMYTNYSVTASNATFFTYQKDYAEQYDRENKNYLVRHLPAYLTDGSEQGENQEYILFLEMIGQHFDVLWAYIRGIHRTKIIRNSAEEGIPDKLVHTLLENLGWDAQQPFGGMQLWKEAFGLNANGTSFTNTNILGNSVTPAYSPEEARKQVWRRLLNNLPYLLKHKGTRRAIYAIMACYGIPQSMLSIVEFSGASLATANTATTTTQNFTYTTQTSQLNLNTTSNVSVPYYPASPPPTSVQVRFATQYQVPASISATGSQLIRMNESASNSYWQVNLLPTGTGSYGDVNFIIQSGSSTSASLSVTSSVLFDNDWKNVTIQKERFQSASIDYDRFTLYVKEAATDRLIMDQSASLILTASNLTNVFTSTGSLYFGSYGSTPGISGALDEVRVWNTALSESVINAHSLNPDVIYGNDSYATTTNLLVRLDFEYPKNRIADPYIKNVSPKVNFSGSTAIGGYTGYATASMTNTATSYPYHYTVYNRTATSKVPKLGFSANDKIRTHTQDVVTNLSHKQRATKKITDTTPIDSNRLGVFFSPVKELNLDILHSLGDINIGDYIGSWEDEYGTDTYSDLNSLKAYYFKRTNINFSEYIKLVRSVDGSFYKMLNQIPGQRVKLVTGLLIEPSILERSKIKITKPQAESAYSTASILYSEDFNLEGEYNEYNIVFDQTDFSKTLDGDVSNYTSSINNTEIVTVLAENNTINSTSSYNIFENLNLSADTIYSIGSNGASVDAYIDAKYEDATILAEFDLEQSYQNVGMDADSPYSNGFGVVGENGAVDRTYRRYDGSLVLTERSNAYILTIKHTRDVPNTNISGITTYETMSRYDKKLLFVTQSDANAAGAFRSPSQHSFYTYITASLGIYPYDNGIVTAIELFDGYTTGHYRFTKDTSRGLQNSYFNGSKQTSLTTLDNASPVEIFSTNPNTLKVSNTGRGSGEPILEVT